MLGGGDHRSAGPLARSRYLLHRDVESGEHPLLALQLGGAGGFRAGHPGQGARDASVTLEVLTPAYAPPEMFGRSPPSPQMRACRACATLSRGDPRTAAALAAVRGQPLPRPPVWRCQPAGSRPASVGDQLINACAPPGRRGGRRACRPRTEQPPLSVCRSGRPWLRSRCPGQRCPGKRCPTRSGPIAAGQPAPRPPGRGRPPSGRSGGRRWLRRWFLGGGDGSRSRRRQPGSGSAGPVRPRRPRPSRSRRRRRGRCRLHDRRRRADRPAQRWSWAANWRTRTDPDPRRPRRGGQGALRRPGRLRAYAEGLLPGVAGRRQKKRGGRRPATPAEVPTRRRGWVAGVGAAGRAGGAAAGEAGSVDRSFRCLAGRGAIRPSPQPHRSLSPPRDRRRPARRATRPGCPGLRACPHRGRHQLRRPRGGGRPSAPVRRADGRRTGPRR